jgi:hypothetical protein
MLIVFRVLVFDGRLASRLAQVILAQTEQCWVAPVQVIRHRIIAGLNGCGSPAREPFWRADRELPTLANPKHILGVQYLRQSWSGLQPESHCDQRWLGLL